MEITAISKRRGHLYQLELLGGEPLLLDIKTVTENGLYVGQELDSQALARLKSDSDYTRAFSRAVWYIERGDLSEKALCDKLKKVGFAPAAISKSAERLAELGLINDEALAERMAARLIECNVSTRQALYKMTLKGIPRDIAKAALDATECDAECQIRAVIDKKYKNKLSNPENTKKVFAALQRLGFGYSDIRSVLKQYSEEIEFSEDNYGL